MKKEKTYNMYKTQIRWSIKDAAAVNANFTQKIKTNGPAVPNHPTFGAAGGKLCNGPPGRARSPGIGDILFPDHPPNNKAEPGASPLSSQREGSGVSQNRLQFFHTEYQSFINYKPNFQFITNIKNFKSMKKQILILAFFVLAMIAGSMSSFGQLLPGITATQPIDPLACIATSEPLHPFPGVPYKYALTNGGAGTELSADWTWWATKDPNFIVPNAGTPLTNMATTQLTVATGDLVAIGATYGVTTPDGATAREVEITWSSKILSQTAYQAVAADAPKTSTFVVGYSKGVNCADNIQVFEIDPMPNFTIDIASIDTTGASPTLAWDAPWEQCVDFVRGAAYNTTSHEIDMDYGKNNFYYEVAAANFVNDWTPTFSIISGLTASQEAIIYIYPTLAAAKAGIPATRLATSPVLTAANMGPADATHGWATATALTAANIADAATGVSLYVRVTVYNKQEESLALSPFVLAVDAIDNSAGTGIWDMEDTDCGTLADAADQVDTATHNIKPRPTLIDATTPETIPNPDTFIIKTP